MYGISVLSSFCVVRFSSVRFKSSSTKLLEFLASMPKPNSARIMESQRQRRVINKKSEKYSPGTIYLQVLGSGARGAPNTLYLFTDQKRYLFNCGECTQRLAHEHKVKLSKLDRIFITSKSWRNIGGLPGLSLTLQDVGVPNITLHGPEGLDELYNATKRFVVLKDMNVTMANCSTVEDFEDNCMTVKYIILQKPDDFLNDSLLNSESLLLKPAAKKPRLDNCSDKEYAEFVNDNTDYYSKSESTTPTATTAKPSKPVSAKPKPKLSEKESMRKKTERVLQELQKKGHSTVAYICKLKNRPGTLDLAKCVEKGVKPGPMLGQLKNGLDVVLQDGTIVYSKDVKTPDDPGPVFIVMEVPELSYLKENEFSPHFDNGVNPHENVPTIIVHFTPPHVFNHPTYRQFLSKFGPTTRHLVLNSQNSCMGSEAVHRTQHKLHLLDTDIFPLLRDASVPAVWNSHPPPANDSPTRRGIEELKNKIALAQFQNIINMEGSKGDGQVCKEEGDGTKLEIITGRTLTMYHLRPKRLLDRSAEPKLHIQDYIQETMDIDGFVGSLEQFRRLVDNVRYTIKPSAKEYPKVVFLGTGSCIPSKTRNTSSIVLQINDTCSILLDCGEGTFGQLVRFFGPKRVNAFLRTLNVIYVSHLHADHHIGLIGVLQARREAFEQCDQEPLPVYLLAPGQIYSWLSLYDQLFEKIICDFTLIPNQSLIVDSPNRNPELTSAVLASIGVKDIQTCLVSHCPNAFGVSIDIDGTHKVTYSGDTIPCDSLVEIGKNSTLLIHEATMEDDLSDEARVKMHSTTSQAIDIGQQMNAMYTVLTHFSQRYARLPRLNQSILSDNRSVGIAFDNMQITMNDLELLPHMYAPLQLMFAEHCVEMEMKAAHRSRHKEQNTSLSDFSNNDPKEDASKSECRGVISAPAPRARYRESNASRLRQEMKGMAITGVVKNVLRSKSSSPARTTSNVQNRVQKNESMISGKDSEKTIALTMGASETFNANKDTDKKKSEANIINSQSSNSSSNKENKDPFKEEILRKSNTSSTSSVISNTTTGYGKPLLTPIHKRVAIRKNSTVGTASPTSTSPPPKTNINTNHKTPPKVKPLKDKTTISSPTQNHSEKSRILPRPVSSTSAKSKVNPTYHIKSVDKKLVEPKPIKPAKNSKPQEPKLANTQLNQRRNSSTEKLKQQFCRDMTMPPGRPNSAIHNYKIFKPQLEDIKSSYLLLNKNQEQNGKKEFTSKESTNVPFSKPPPVDENTRRLLLDQAKKKFQSRSFMEDARYEKIEGLNWISWK